MTIQSCAPLPSKAQERICRHAQPKPSFMSNGLCLLMNPHWHSASIMTYDQKGHRQFYHFSVQREQLDLNIHMRHVAGIYSVS